MTIKELFEMAMKGDYTDLQALIMFLTLEKKVLSMDDDDSELDLYFLDKHSKKMNEELHKYKEKMNITYGMQVYEIKTSNRTLYISAYTEKQARFIASENLINVEEIKICHKDNTMSYDNVDIKLSNIIKDKNVGILGGY